MVGLYMASIVRYPVLAELAPAVSSVLVSLVSILISICVIRGNRQMERRMDRLHGRFIEGKLAAVPNDSQGRPLKVGDRVTITCEVLCEVVVVHDGESAGQVSLVAVGDAGTAGGDCPTVTLNSKSTTLAAAGKG